MALFQRLHVEEAWKVTKGDPGILIGVIDSGFDFFHPALREQVKPGFYYPGGYHTETFANLAHGTAVASLIVARPQASDSPCGLAPHCTVLAASQGSLENLAARIQAEFFRAHPEATAPEVQKELATHREALTQFANDWAAYQIIGAAQAISYLVDHGCCVINISGLLRRSQCPAMEAWAKLENAFADAGRRNTVIVLGAGNDAVASEDYPGDGQPVVVVGATRLNDQRWEEERSSGGAKVKLGSNFGRRLTCMAPVENLLVCLPHEKRMYEWESGPALPMKVPFKGIHDLRPAGATSDAAPMVSALAGLILSARPDFDAKTVIRLIEQGCDDIGEPGYDIHTGHGRVNFAKSLRLAQHEPPK